MKLEGGDEFSGTRVELSKYDVPTPRVPTMMPKTSASRARWTTAYRRISSLFVRPESALAAGGCKVGSYDMTCDVIKKAFTESIIAGQTEGRDEIYLLHTSFSGCVINMFVRPKLSGPT